MNANTFSRQNRRPEKRKWNITENRNGWRHSQHCALWLVHWGRGCSRIHWRRRALIGCSKRMMWFRNRVKLSTSIHSHGTSRDWSCWSLSVFRGKTTAKFEALLLPLLREHPSASLSDHGQHHGENYPSFAIENNGLSSPAWRAHIATKLTGISHTKQCVNCVEPRLCDVQEYSGHWCRIGQRRHGIFGFG